MFRLAVLLCIAAVGTADPGFRPKHQYEYNYEGKMLTGIPGLAPQWSGCGIRGKLIVQEVTSNKLHVQLTQTEFAAVESLYVPRSWKDHFPWEFGTVPQGKTHLESPIVVLLRNGQVEQMTVHHKVPQEIVNLQKSIISTLQLNLKPERHTQIFPSDVSAYRSYKVMEKGIGGECETTYEISRVPDYLVLELKKTQKWSSQIPATDSIYHVTKTRNHENCYDIPAFQHLAPAPIRSQPGWLDNNGTAANRSSVSNYYLSGDLSHYTIQYVEMEGETTIYPFGHRTEHLFSVSNQTMQLTRVQPISTPIPEPAAPRRMSNLTYIYPTYEELPQDSVPLPPLRQPPPFSMIYPGVPEKELRKHLPYEVLKSKINELLQKILQNLNVSPVGQDKDLPLTVICLERALSMLSKEQLEQVYRHETGFGSSQQKETKKQVLIEAMLVAGTNPTITQLLTLIQQKELSPERASQVIMFLPMYVKTPTKELIEEIFKYIRSPPVQESKPLKITSYLAFTNILRQSCVTPQTYLKSTPVHVFGQFCDPSWPEISSVYVPYFQQEADKALEQEDTLSAGAYVQALGNIGHKSVIQALEPYVTGRKTQSQLVRTKAIYAFQNLTKSEQRLVQSILAPVFHNYTTSEKVRLAALTMLFHSNPPLPYWHKIATSTWYEPCEQVVAFVHSTLASMANTTVAEQQHHYEMAHKARLALPLARPTPSGLLYTHKLYFSSMIKELLVGSNIEATWLGSYHSAVPSTIFFEVQNYYNGYIYNPLRVSTDTNGIQSLIDKYIGPEGIWRKLFSEEGIQEAERSSPRDISEIASDITKLMKNIEPRKAESIEIASYFKLWGAVDRYFYLSKEALQRLLNGQVPYPEFFEKLENGYPINYQKYYKSKEITVAVPSEIGFPLIYSMQRPTVLSVRGLVKVKGVKELIEGRATQNITVEVKDLETRADFKAVAKLGHVCPFTLKFYGARVDTTFQLSVPLNASLAVNLTSHNASISAQFTPQQQQTFRPGRMEIIPYTFSYPLAQLTPSSEQQASKIIHPEQKPPTEKEVQLLQKAIGIDMKAILKTDYTFHDFATVYQYVKQFTPVTALSYWNKLWTVKYNSIDFQVNPRTSETQELSAQLALNWTGSGEPFTPPQSHISPEEQPEYLEQVKTISLQELAQQKPSEGYRGLAVAAQVNLTGRVTRRASAYVATAASIDWQKQSYVGRVYLLKPQSSDKYQICSSGEAKLPKVPEERQEILASPLRVQYNGKVMFGEQCSPNKIITVQGYVEKDERVRQYASKTPEANKCELDERIKFTQSPACVKAQVQAAMLNHLYVDVKYQGLSEKLLNLTYKASDWSKYLLFPYTQNDPVSHEGRPKEVQVDAYLDPALWALDVHLNKPQEKTHYNSIRIPGSQLYPLYYIPSIKPSVSNKVSQLVQGLDKVHCTVQQDKIKTFDNVTLTATIPSQCYAVLASDCSLKSRLVIQAKSQMQSKFVKVWVDKETIETIPHVGSPQPKVKVNGNERPLSPEKPIIVRSRSDIGMIVAKIYLASPSTVSIQLPKHSSEVITDTKYVHLRMNPLYYRNKACGICADKNGEKTAEMRSPGKCVLTEAQKMVDSYAPCRSVEIPECVKVPEVPTSQVVKI